VRGTLTVDQSVDLGIFCQRAAVFAIRENSIDYVTCGLTAITALEEDKADFRDILVALALLHHSARRIGADADGLFRRAASAADEKVKERISSFLEGDPESRDLRRSWLYEEAQTEGGFGFVRWGNEAYRPSYDLKRMAIELADLVMADKYLPDRVEVASKVPLEQSIAAGAAISARLRPNEQPKHHAYALEVFVAELETKRIALALRESVRAMKPQDRIAMTAFAEARLLCLVVARSTVNHLRTIETPESLARFSMGISTVLRRYAGVHPSGAQ
jgi:hypothetical protein